jgi:small-conductance mechanosensitive channel
MTKLRALIARLLALLAFLISPPAVALACFVAGSGLAVAGVYALAGLGWAYLASSVPLLMLAAVLARGLKNAG